MAKDKLGSERNRVVMIGCPNCKDDFELKVGESISADNFRGGCDTCGDYTIDIRVRCSNCGHVLLEGEDQH